MKRQKRVSISIKLYMNIYIYICERQTDRQRDMRPGLLKGEWGQGRRYTGPSPAGDSPADILCLDEPSTSLTLLFHLLLFLLPLLAPSPYSGHSRHPLSPKTSSIPSSLSLPLVGMKPCQNASILKGHLKRRPH